MPWSARRLVTLLFFSHFGAEIIMDPTSAIGLAASIVQLTCFAGDLLSKTREIKDSANETLMENQELEAVTSSLQELSRDLSAGSRNLTKADKQLKALCDGCQSATEDLLDVVQKLRTSNSHKGWQSFRQAVLTVWKEKQVRSLTERLERYRGQINLALLVTLNERMGQLGSTIAGSTSNVRRRNYGNVQSSRLDRSWQNTIIDEVRQNHWTKKKQARPGDVLGMLY